MSSINKNLIANFYNNRFNTYGAKLQAVGWGSNASQIMRFDILFRGINPKGRLILDVGCGLADLLPYLDNITKGDFKYIGVDVAEELVNSAKNKYKNTNHEFYVGDIFSVDIPKVDIAVLSGALSFKLEGIDEYAFDTIKKMYELSNQVASLNFLSKYVDFEEERNKHYQPEELFLEAKKITKFVNLFHDYPLYEFTLQLFKPTFINHTMVI
jgi:SAM-dependent methyltransferase